MSTTPIAAYILSALLLATASRLCAQSVQPGEATAPIPVSDLQLIGQRQFTAPGEFAHYHGAGNSEQTLKNRHTNFIAQYNPVSLVLKGALLGYQKLVSEQLARSCPYEITC